MKLQGGRRGKVRRETAVVLANHSDVLFRDSRHDGVAVSDVRLAGRQFPTIDVVGFPKRSRGRANATLSRAALSVPASRRRAGRRDERETRRERTAAGVTLVKVGTEHATKQGRVGLYG